MRAVVFRGARQLGVETVRDPEPRPEELVLRVSACGICGSDLHLYRSGMLPPGAIMGHEFAGEVMEEAHGFRAGERVTSIPTLSCGRCERCRTGLSAFCTQGGRPIGLGPAPGALAEYVCVVPHNLVRLPEAVTSERGALVEPLAVGLHAVNAAALERGEVAVVLGAGPVGLAIAVWLRHFGARRIVVSDPSPGRRDAARQLGADAAVHPTEEGGLLAATRRFAPSGVPLLFEATGVAGMLAQALTSIGFRGRIVVAGVCNAPDSIFPLAAILKEASFRFVLAYERADFEYTVDMLEQARLPLDGFVSDRIRFDDTPAMFETLERPTTQSKVVVVP